MASPPAPDFQPDFIGIVDKRIQLRAAKPDYAMTVRWQIIC
jgi:hypothetical protein